MVYFTTLLFVQFCFLIFMSKFDCLLSKAQFKDFIGQWENGLPVLDKTAIIYFIC